MQNFATYLIILIQSYITATRMETRVLDDGSHYARIHSLNGRKIVQFITAKPIHERHREELRGMPLEPRINFVDF